MLKKKKWKNASYSRLQVLKNNIIKSLNSMPNPFPENTAVHLKQARCYFFLFPFAKTSQHLRTYERHLSKDPKKFASFNVTSNIVSLPGFLLANDLFLV